MPCCCSTRKTRCGLVLTAKVYKTVYTVIYVITKPIKAFVRILGAKLFFFIILVSHLLKGFVAGGGSGGLIGVPILFLLRSYTGVDRLNASEMQVYVTAAMTPWALKPLFGILSDTVYWGGYNKIPYVFATTYISILCCVSLAFMWPISPVVVVFLLVGIFMQVAMTDLLTEAKYSEKITQNSGSGTEIVMFVWSGIFICQIFATLLTTFLLENIAPNWIYLVPVIPLILFLYPVYDNWICERLHRNTDNHDGSIAALRHTGGAFTYLVHEDVSLDHPLVSPTRLEENYDKDGDLIVSDHVTNCFGDKFWFNQPYHKDEEEEEEDEEGTITVPSPKVLVSTTTTTYVKEIVVYTPLVGVNLNKLKRERNTVILAFLIGGISLLTFFLGMLQVDARILFVVSLLSAVAMIIGFFLLVDRTIAKVQTFVIIQNMFTISVSTATFFFYTDSPEQYPEGPHFSIFFYVTVMGLVGSVCALLGNLSYQVFLKHWRYRTVFLFTNGTFIFVSLLNIVLYTRFNLVLGIPDAVFVLGAEAFQDVISAWTSMPVLLIMSQLCPEGMEATIFAILAGSSNLGSALARYQSVAIMNMFDITPSGAIGESAKFDNLWKASLISILAPVIPLLLVPFLIPDGLQTEPVLPANAKSTLAPQSVSFLNEDNSVHLSEDG